MVVQPYEKRLAVYEYAINITSSLDKNQQQIDQPLKYLTRNRLRQGASVIAGVRLDYDVIDAVVENGIKLGHFEKREKDLDVKQANYEVRITEKGKKVFDKYKNPTKWLFDPNLGRKKSNNL